mmetsp:Transcript_10025/g.22517  ORF Transcript_10025/g.22517 Transcript_10025/m.22517 type:complete len:305 (-) Transcript_10025:149-1063(-)
MFLLTTTAVAASLSEWLFEQTQVEVDLSLHGAFVTQMANGSLPHEVFQTYFDQDNLYLREYARVFDSLASSARDDEEFMWLTSSALSYLQEHGSTHSRRNISNADFENLAMPVTKRYTSLQLDAAAKGDRLLTFASVLPCQKLYDFVFTTLQEQGVADDNPYKEFIQQYATEEVKESTRKLSAYLDKEAALLDSVDPAGSHHTEERKQEALRMYREAMDLEAAFFQQGFNKPPPPVEPEAKEATEEPNHHPTTAAVAEEEESDDGGSVDVSVWIVAGLVGAAAVVGRLAAKRGPAPRALRDSLL